MHPLLKRQLKRQFGSPEAAPESLHEFIERINVDYEKCDADHAQGLHALALEVLAIDPAANELGAAPSCVNP